MPIQDQNARFKISRMEGDRALWLKYFNNLSGFDWSPDETEALTIDGFGVDTIVTILNKVYPDSKINLQILKP